MIYKIIAIVLGIVSLALTFVGYYFHIHAKIALHAAKAVNESEEEDKSGEEKLKLAVDQLSALVPACLKPLFTRSRLQKIVQEIFDKIEEYAKKQVKKGK